MARKEQWSLKNRKRRDLTRSTSIEGRFDFFPANVLLKFSILSDMIGRWSLIYGALVVAVSLGQVYFLRKMFDLSGPKYLNQRAWSEQYALTATLKSQLLMLKRKALILLRHLHQTDYKQINKKDIRPSCINWTMHLTLVPMERCPIFFPAQWEWGQLLRTFSHVCRSTDVGAETRSLEIMSNFRLNVNPRPRILSGRWKHFPPNATRGSALTFSANTERRNNE